MKIQGEQILSVPRGDVWHALNDPAILKRCLPSCDAFEADGENRYRVALQASVGPVRARFLGKLQLSEIVLPSSYVLNFEGSGGVAGFGKGTAQVSLEDVPGGTRLKYSTQAQVGGRLAQVSARLIDGVTNRMADDFFSRFAKELKGGNALGLEAASQKSEVVRPDTLQLPQVQASPLQSNLIAVIAAAVSVTAAAVTVLAALFVTQITR